ncbi:PREDICTED: trichohyalin-like [Eufriesea mexicana]|uniref:trichohyalin-like n=1 Tax=Eufriesea mexicana TaxID=516756 RepID=UPI00083BC3C0|nr:PREDICTED: trichohyalin-like [Eufriesea mexicana]
MLTQYTYIKPRHQFGKQCVFTVEHVGKENIMPEPELMESYVIRTRSHRRVQVAKQFAVHEAQTTIKSVSNAGVLHTEGGWPREINPRDSEAVQRFRRRVEKDDSWTMKRYLLQNNAVNIYQNFFDDLVPKCMAKDYNIRVSNLFEDPETKVRPIRDLSWSPNGSDRLAVAYGFMEFEEHSADVSPYSYVWDIENPNKALHTLKSSSQLMTVEFNPRDPVLLLSGLITGQVCYWDIRNSGKPAQTSHLYTSHRNPAIQTIWISSKTNTDFFSSSTDGMVLWWDVRYMRKPTEVLVMDLDNPKRADISKAVGVTALQFEQTMSSKFLAGTENGIVVNVNRRMNNPVEKVAVRFECYTGAVITIDRNPIYTKNFLTVGNWTAKVWADDTKEGSLLSTRNKLVDLSGGCWSKSRCSVFFIINTQGVLEAYDVLAGLKAPLAKIHICKDSLTSINAHKDGDFLAVGSSNGKVYLLECTEDFGMFSKEDRLALNNYLESRGRYEKVIDSRLKEFRLARGVSQDSQHKDTRELKSKSKKKDHKEKKEHKEKKKEKLSTTEKEMRKKSRTLKPKGKSSVRMTYPELNRAEMDYFNKIDEISATYTPLDEADVVAAQPLLNERRVVKEPEEEAEPEKEEMKRQRSVRKIRSRTKTVKGCDVYGSQASNEMATETLFRGSMYISLMVFRYKLFLNSELIRKLESERKARQLQRMKEHKMMADDVPEKSRSFIMDNKWFRRLTDYIIHIPVPSPAARRKILAAKNTPPNVLRRELQEAKKEIRAWQEKALAKKLSSWAIERKLKVRAETPTEDKSEAKKETVEDEEAKEHVAKVEKTKRIVRPAVTVKKQPSLRRSKKLKLTEDDIELQKKEEQMEFWNILKKKVKQYDEQHQQVQSYPRISAAYPKASLEELPKRDSAKEIKLTCLIKGWQKLKMAQDMEIKLVYLIKGCQKLKMAQVCYLLYRESERKARQLQRMKEHKMMADDVPEKSRSFIMDNKWFRRLTDYIIHIPVPSPAARRKILAAKNTPPNVLRRELQEAKKEIRAWQEKALAKKLSSWAIERKLKVRAETPTEDKSEAKKETVEDEEAKEHVAKVEKTKRIVRPAVTVKKQPSLRRSKKLKLTEDDIELQKKEEQMEFWNILKKKVKQYDEQHQQVQSYPRISAAYPKASLEELPKRDSVSKKKH